MDLEAFSPELELNEPLEVDGVMPLAFCKAASAKGLLGFLLKIEASFLRLITSWGACAADVAAAGELLIVLSRRATSVLEVVSVGGRGQ